VTLVGIVVLLALGGLGYGLTNAWATGDSAVIPRMVGAAFVQAAALWVLAGVALALFGAASRVALLAFAVLALALTGAGLLAFERRDVGDAA
jgi:ABC-2 type transport system permease protein